MAGKPNARNWSDVQIMLLSISLVISLGLWNLFASADLGKYADDVQSSPSEAPIVTIEFVTPTPPQNVFLLLGGESPQTPTPAPVAQTSSSSSSRKKGAGGGVKPPGGGGGGGGTGGS